VAVEAALVTPIILLLVLGILEFSFILRDFVAVSSVVRVGARIASANPGAGPASCTPPSAPAFAGMAANAIQQAGTAMPQDSINYIIVYQANSKGYPAPAGTASTAIPTNAATTPPPAGSATPCTAFANCVAYRWVDASDQFAYASGTWSSASVDACPASAYNVGVWMRATHKNITGFFGSTKNLGDKTVMKFEPLPTTSCNPSAPQPHL
jgi:Flp pilus assembly protein TadG